MWRERGTDPDRRVRRALPPARRPRRRHHDLTVSAASPARRLARGLTRRCVDCGHRGAFESYFRLRPRCLTCGHRPAEDEGFFLGVWVVNFAVSEGLLFVALMAYIIAMGASGGDVPLLPVLGAGVLVAVAAPIAFYPFAAGTWAAIDLVMDPARRSSSA